MNPRPTISSIASLLFPSKCISCSRLIENEGEESKICISCKEFLRARLVASTRGSLKLFAGSKYSMQMAHIVLAAKEDNQIAARKVLALNLTLSLEHVSKQMVKNKKQNPSRIILIPIPSRKASDRKRGFSHIQLLISEFQIRNMDMSLIRGICIIRLKEAVSALSNSGWHWLRNNVLSSRKKGGLT